MASARYEILVIFYEEDGKRREEGRGGDKAKAEEQPAVEPIAVDSKDATKVGIAAIITDTANITDAVSDDARASSFWMRMHTILQVGLWVRKRAFY